MEDLQVLITTFRKELGDLRQDEIRRGVERSVVRTECGERMASRASAAVASVLHRIAWRLEGPSDLARERDRIVLREP
jgi:hypothetical protein